MPNNPILEDLAPNSMPSGNGLQEIMKLIRLAKSAKDPVARLQMMAQQLPGYEQAVKYVQENGGDPKAACFKLAKENGVNLQELLSSF